VDFCARTFDALAAYSDPHAERIALAGSFDLIWVGSLFTHLPPDAWRSFLRLFHSLLAADGVLVLTAEGRFVADQLRLGRGRLGLAPGGVSRIVAAYAQDGFAFEAFEGNREYGCFLSSPSWVCSQIERLAHTRLLYFHERGWMGRQDVIACVRDAQYVGFLDRADVSGVSGWAWDALRPESAVVVEVLVDGTLRGTVEADKYRQDLLAAGIGDGNHGFSFRLPAETGDGREHQIHVRISGTTVGLRRSPRTVRE
jgi:SAM-dependent methyltransferase